MTKNEFLTLLNKELLCLPSEDSKKITEYYSEIIDEMTDDGNSEEKAVESIGSVEKIVSDILADTPLNKIIKQKTSPKRKLSAFEIVLIVLGSPIWLSVIISIIAVVVTVYISLWAIIAAFYSAALCFAVSSLAFIAAGIAIIIKGFSLSGIFLIGGGLLSAGMAVITTFLSNIIAKYIIILGKKIWLGIKFCIAGKGRKK